MSREFRVFLFANRVPLFTVRPDSLDKNWQNVEGGILFKDLPMGKSNQEFRPNRVCEVCGKPFSVYVQPSRIREGLGRFCSIACSAENQRKQKITVICETCKRPFEVHPYRAQTARFCSVRCQAKWVKEKRSGEDSWNYKGKVKLICPVCNSSYEVYPSEIKNNIRIVCSTECRKIWMSQHYSGENASNWQGGISYAPYPTTFNRAFKQLIRERDGYTCAVCGNTGNNVHHINYVKGDTTPENCITLCMFCHLKTNYNRSYWQSFFENIMRQRGFAK